MAILKNTTVSDTGSIQLPVGTTAQRVNPLAGSMRFNSTTGRAEIYNSNRTAWLGTNTPVLNVVATGGNRIFDITDRGINYRVHVFTQGTSNFTVTQPGTVEYLIVAGGGGGGVCYGGGGGAGGLITGTTTVVAQSYSIVVGAGGTNRVNVGGPGGNGGNSSAFGLTTTGGGGGGGNCGGAGSNGGSGGGGSSTGSVSGAAGTGVSGQGNAGALSPNGAGNEWGGGGGGAGSAAAGSRGGFGIYSQISGVGAFYAGGGQGSRDAVTRDGGVGGGGAGGTGLAQGIANGGPNTGGGGGGSIITGSGGSSGIGGSGIVIIRYRIVKELVTPVDTPVTNGLVLSIDVGNRLSYPGVGTIINDSISAIAVGTLINTVDNRHIFSNASAFEFNGSNSHISITPIPRSPAFTFEAWVLTRNVSLTRQYIYTQQANPPTQAQFTYMDRQGLFFSGNTLQCQYLSTSTPADAGAITSSQTFANNIWYHVVVTHTGTTANMYINGSRDTGAALSGTQTTRIPMINQAFIGRRGDAQGDDYFNGLIAQVKDYNRALTADEVTQNFNVTRWRYGV